jgi:hypothetical protein
MRGVNYGIGGDPEVVKLPSEEFARRADGA